jgi:membrane-associated phospholipid phosphatase
VPAALRPLAIAILGGCAAGTAVLAALVAGQTRPGPIDRWVDARIQGGLGGQWRGLQYLAAIGDVTPVVVMISVLVLACLVTRRGRGAVLAAVAVPAAAGLAELVLKPLVGRTLLGALSFPSGTEARVFAVAAVFAVLMADPVRPRIPAAVRLAVAVAVLLAAVAVGVAMVALNQHYFTDTLGGAAVGTAAALATALILDRLA